MISTSTSARKLSPKALNALCRHRCPARHRRSRHQRSQRLRELRRRRLGPRSCERTRTPEDVGREEEASESDAQHADPCSAETTPERASTPAFDLDRVRGRDRTERILQPSHRRRDRRGSPGARRPITTELADEQRPSIWKFGFRDMNSRELATIVSALNNHSCRGPQTLVDAAGG